MHKMSWRGRLLAEANQLAVIGSWINQPIKEPNIVNTLPVIIVLTARLTFFHIKNYLQVD